MNTLTTVEGPKTGFSRLSSVFLADRIEPCLEFWVDRLGFEVRLQIEGEDRLEFVILGRGDLEIMYRTLGSIEFEAPGLLDEQAEHRPWVVMYLEVEDLGEILPRLDGVEVVVPLRETILGQSEVFVREPSGRILALSGRAA